MYRGRWDPAVRKVLRVPEAQRVRDMRSSVVRCPGWRLAKSLLASILFSDVHLPIRLDILAANCSPGPFPSHPLGAVLAREAGTQRWSSSGLLVLPCRSAPSGTSQHAASRAELWPTDIAGVDELSGRPPPQRYDLFGTSLPVGSKSPRRVGASSADYKGAA